MWIELASTQEVESLSSIHPSILKAFQAFFKTFKQDFDKPTSSSWQLCFSSSKMTMIFILRFICYHNSNVRIWNFKRHSQLNSKWSTIMACNFWQQLLLWLFCEPKIQRSPPAHANTETLLVFTVPSSQLKKMKCHLTQCWSCLISRLRVNKFLLRRWSVSSGELTLP